MHTLHPPPYSHTAPSSLLTHCTLLPTHTLHPPPYSHSAPSSLLTHCILLPTHTLSLPPYSHTAPSSLLTHCTLLPTHTLHPPPYSHTAPSSLLTHFPLLPTHILHLLPTHTLHPPPFFLLIPTPTHQNHSLIQTTLAMRMQLAIDIETLEQTSFQVIILQYMLYVVLYNQSKYIRIGRKPLTDILNGQFTAIPSTCSCRCLSYSIRDSKQNQRNGDVRRHDDCNTYRIDIDNKMSTLPSIDRSKLLYRYTSEG